MFTIDTMLHLTINYSNCAEPEPKQIGFRWSGEVEKGELLKE